MKPSKNDLKIIVFIGLLITHRTDDLFFSTGLGYELTTPYICPTSKLYKLI